VAASRAVGPVEAAAEVAATAAAEAEGAAAVAVEAAAAEVAGAAGGAGEAVVVEAVVAEGAGAAAVAAVAVVVEAAAAAAEEEAVGAAPRRWRAGLRGTQRRQARGGCAATAGACSPHLYNVQEGRKGAPAINSGVRRVQPTDERKTREREGVDVYIGVGTLVAIILIVLLIYILV
jgi:hypothetical protein